MAKVGRRAPTRTPWAVRGPSLQRLLVRRVRCLRPRVLLFRCQPVSGVETSKPDRPLLHTFFEREVQQPDKSSKERPRRRSGTIAAIYPSLSSPSADIVALLLLLMMLQVMPGERLPYHMQSLLRSDSSRDPAASAPAQAFSGLQWILLPDAHGCARGRSAPAATHIRQGQDAAPRRLKNNIAANALTACQVLPRPATNGCQDRTSDASVPRPEALKA
ncbi:hypothetical protein BC628DRAFT_232322 [Trametes gibbosa]|nr:hypothetical protein BC628DRAFT_232322 [Trametes gibbosa]